MAEVEVVPAEHQEEVPQREATAGPAMHDGSQTGSRRVSGEEAEEAQRSSTTALSEEVEEEAAGASPLPDGMRREWNFSLSFAHQTARIELQCSPQWELLFIDPEEIEDLNRLDRDIKHCPLTPVLKYCDLSAVTHGNNAQRGAATEDGLSEPAGAATSGAMEDWWVEKEKHVELLYSHIPPDMTLAGFCTTCVQHVLKNPQVISIDGDANLARLRLGSKLRCRHRLGGARSFHFPFRLRNKVELMNEVAYAIGTVIGQRGYLLLVRCVDEQELDGYLQKLLLPYYSNTVKVHLDTDVSYAEVPSIMLSDHLHLYGELRYEDRDAAASFCFPAHPIRFRPDFSPAKTVGVGSIACMTLELRVHEKLIDDAAVAEITGMPKFKVNQIVLCLDVEDVARMGYPSVMSTEQYSSLKTERILGVFADAKVIGLPTTVQMGGRMGRARTVSFSYEPMDTVVKAMLVSTLVGNFGITALYLTKLGGGVFDTHLYLYQQLLNAVVYHQQHLAAAVPFSRFHVVNVRLQRQDLPQAYIEAPVDKRQVMHQHLKAILDSTDGFAEGAVQVLVPPEEGGIHRRNAPASVSKRSLSITPSATPLMPTASKSAIELLPLPSDDQKDRSQPSVQAADEEGAAAKEKSAEVVAGDVGEEEEQQHQQQNSGSPGDTEGADSAAWDQYSVHSQSVISVTSISRLLQSDSEEHDLELSEGRHSESATPEAPNLDERASTQALSPERKDGDEPGRSGSLLVNPVGQQTSPTCEETASPCFVNQGTTEGAAAPSATSPVAAAASADAEGGARPAEELVCFIGETAEEESRVAAQAQATSIRHALAMDDGAYCGPSLRDVYVRCCDMQRCRPNSYLLKKLPADARFTESVEEVDLTSNYLGRNGFVALLNLFEHLPKLRHVYLNDMSLDNVDAENLCEVLSTNKSITAVHLKRNPKITLPATRHFSKLLNLNPRIVLLALDGTRLGDSVVTKLQNEAKSHRTPPAS